MSIRARLVMDNVLEAESSQHGVHVELPCVILFIVVGADIHHLEVLNTHCLDGHIFEEEIAPKVVDNRPVRAEQCKHLLAIQLPLVEIGCKLGVDIPSASQCVCST